MPIPGMFSCLKLVSIDMSTSISLLFDILRGTFEATLSDLLSILHPGSRVLVPNIVPNIFFAPELPAV
jgi:hypothetical protein